MIHLAPKFSMLDFITAIMIKLEHLRIHQKSRAEFSRIDSHTLQDLGICDTMGLIEETKRMREK